MAKQKSCPKYVYKIHTSKLAESNWDLSLPLSEAVANKTDIISLSSSQTLRFIDEINGVDTDEMAKQIKNTIRFLSNQERPNRARINNLYQELYEIQFVPDYMCLIIDKKSDYDRANRGFYINGIKYKRLLGTNGGIKNSTIVFVSERIYPKLKEKMDCGRNMNIPLVPAKLEAYQALMCSGSIPLSMPKGIIVVNDCVTEFYEDVIEIDDSDDSAIEPSVKCTKNKKLELIDSDGYGFMLPGLSRRWNGELGGDPEKTISAVNTRGIPWTKGMLFTFDFIDFAEKIANKYTVIDVWGIERDVRDAEVILTESMLKLWSCYDSFEDYWNNVEKYGYQFAISKAAPHELENERCTNYQFLQSYELTDAEIKELVQPTVDYIKSASGMKYEHSVLFLGGDRISQDNVDKTEDDHVKALMIEPKLINDPYVRSILYKSIKKKIKQAKIGVLRVRGNFAIIGGDLYSLAQNMFGIEVTGLLKAGEIYHKYWSDSGVPEVCCFRAPMTSHNNIRKMNVTINQDMAYWYQYIETCCLLNSWDSTCEALNGCDKDGDLIFTTNNKVLLDNTKELPAVCCIQRRAEKKIVEEKDLIVANKNSFGDAIGTTTNYITSQICLQADFDKDSREYKELSTRILAGQLLQQNAVDKAKGIISKPMPKFWIDSRHMPETCTEEDLRVYQNIVADKKPYFFIYNYDTLMKEYRKYINDAEASCLRKYGKTIENIESQDEFTESEEETLYWYYKRFPVNMSGCVMNRICWELEKELQIPREKYPDFDSEILKSGNTYNQTKYRRVINALGYVFEEYQYRLAEYSKMYFKGKKGNSSGVDGKRDLDYLFSIECTNICQDEEMLCDALIDLCYSSNKTKQLVWNVCGSQIIKNLLKKSGGNINYFIKDKAGEISFCGDRYTMKRKQKGDGIND